MASVRKAKQRPEWEITDDEARSMFDREAQRTFGISGEEWLRRYDAGEIDVDDPAIHNRAIALEMIILWGRAGQQPS